MTHVPFISESAPFNAEQCLWLNGFLAGLFSPMPGGAPQLNAAPPWRNGWRQRKPSIFSGTSRAGSSRRLPNHGKTRPFCLGTEAICRELWITTQTTNTVTVIDTGTHNVLARFDVGRDPNWVGFTPDGRLAVVSNTGSNDVSIVDVARREVIGTLPVGRSPKRLAVGAIFSNRR